MLQYLRVKEAVRGQHGPYGYHYKQMPAPLMGGVTHEAPVSAYRCHRRDIKKKKKKKKRLSCWYLTIQEFNPSLRYLPGYANIAADSLSRNIHVGVVTNACPVINNFSFAELAVAQRQHDVWGKVIYALESGDDTKLPSLLIPFQQLFLSEEKVLCQYWPTKKEPVVQYVIPECYVPAVVQMVHDNVIVGHPGHECTLTSAHESYCI